MRKLGLSIALALAGFGAQAASLGLSSYHLTGTYALPAGTASEASAVTWNADSNHLFVLGDEGDALVEVTLQGTQVSAMTLTGFDDTEGLAYIGGGKFVVTEERLQDAYLLSYTAGGTVARSSLPSASLGPTVGNVGIEGISYDASNGSFVAVKEKTPQGVYAVSINFAAASATVSNLFVPNLGTADLSDVQVLSNGNLLILSQESARLLEVSRSGQVLGSIDLSSMADNIEGVTIDDKGTIYLVGENPELYVLSAPVPEAQTWAMLVAGLGALAGVRRKRRG